MRDKVKNILKWIDRHPRTGWYVAVVVTIDLLAQIVPRLL